MFGQASLILSPLMGSSVRLLVRSLEIALGYLFWYESMYLGTKDLTADIWLAALHIFRIIKVFLNFQANFERPQITSEI